MNEAYLRLVDADATREDRAHFFAVAATTMRRILVDYARAKGRKKRAGLRVSLEESVIVAPDREAELGVALPAAAGGWIAGAPGCRFRATSLVAGLEQS